MTTPPPQAPPDYDPSAFARPSVTVDVVIFTVKDHDLKVLLIERGQPPFAGAWALPGGFVQVGDAQGDQGESLDDAAARELAEETGLAEGKLYLEQVGAFGAPYRDPRMRIISVAYFALVRADWVPLVEAGSDAAEARFFSLAEEVPGLDLAFDHADILAAALERLRHRIHHAPLAFQLVPSTFTVAELRHVYEAIEGTGYDPGNFQRRVQRMVDDGVLEQAPGRRSTGRRPAQLYRFLDPG